MTLKKILSNLLEIITGFFVTVVITLTTVNVLMRFFYKPIPWAEEVVTICFVYSIIVCLSYVGEKRKLFPYLFFQLSKKSMVTSF